MIQLNLFESTQPSDGDDKTCIKCKRVLGVENFSVRGNEGFRRTDCKTSLYCNTDGDCNTAIGLFKDDKDSLSRAIEYLTYNHEEIEDE